MGERGFCYRCMEQYDSEQHSCPHCGYDNSTPSNPMYIAPGTVLRDRYLVGVLLEFNGEGATYIGHDLSTGCKVTLREYMPVNFCTRVKNKATISVNYNNLAKYKAFMAEYTELNKSLARLRNNSNIVPVLDMFADNNTTYTVFEHIEGEKLLDYLKDNAGELSWEQVSKIFPPLFTTIGILHNAGIIHRAISPDTIYITNKGELKLSGFCVSAVRTADAGLEYELFKGYAAPEQYSASSSSRQGTWTDVYSVCAILYRSLTGCMPVDSASRLKHDDLCEPAMLNPGVPANVSKVIMDGMNLSGRDRIQTITELVTRLFEQPAPVRPVISHAAPDPEPAPYTEAPVQQMQQPQRQFAGNPNNANNYGNNGNYPPPPPPQYYDNRGRRDDDDDEYDDYSYEKVTTVDRLKVPVIIGILLLAILLIISVFLMRILGLDTPNEESSAPKFSGSSPVSDVSEPTFAEPKPDTEMPDLVGKFLKLTEEKYQDYFRIEPTYEYDNDHEADMILEQDIEPGTYVPQGSVVRVKVSKGKEGANIPDYNGLTVSQYKNKLEEVGISNFSFVISSNNYGYPDTITQLQVDGKTVNPGSFFSNKEGKKLIVYYHPKDSDISAPTAAPVIETTIPPTTAAAAAPTDPPYVAPTDPPYVAPTDPPAPPPAVVDPPPAPPEGGGDNGGGDNGGGGDSVDTW